MITSLTQQATNQRNSIQKNMADIVTWNSVRYLLLKTKSTIRLTRRCFVESEYLRPRPQGGCEWAEITYFVVGQSTPFFQYLV